MPQLFADIRTPYINEATLKRVMSSRVKDNIFQGIFIKFCCCRKWCVG